MKKIVLLALTALMMVGYDIPNEGNCRFCEERRQKELKELVIKKRRNKAMKCKDCTVDCHYRTSDGEKECEFQNHIIELPDEWRGVRIQAAIVAMQGVMNFFRFY